MRQSKENSMTSSEPQVEEKEGTSQQNHKVTWIENGKMREARVQIAIQVMIYMEMSEKSLWTGWWSCSNKSEIYGMEYISNIGLILCIIHWLRIPEKVVVIIALRHIWIYTYTHLSLHLLFKRLDSQLPYFWHTHTLEELVDCTGCNSCPRLLPSPFNVCWSVWVHPDAYHSITLCGLRPGRFC